MERETIWIVPDPAKLPADVPNQQHMQRKNCLAEPGEPKELRNKELLF